MFQKIYKFIFFSLFIFLILISGSQNSGFAHPNPLVFSQFKMVYEVDKVSLEYRLSIDTTTLNDVYKDIDINDDELTSEEEVKLYWENVVSKNLVARLNNIDLNFEYDSSTLINKKDFRTLNDFLEIRLVAKEPVILETNFVYLKYNKKYVPQDPYGDAFYYIDNIVEVKNIERINLDQTNPNGLDEYSTYFKFLDNVPDNEKESQPIPENSWFDYFKNLSTNLTNQVREYDFNNPFLFIVAFIFLFIAGALHALTPGHGKSMVAAFLVGKKGSKIGDVLILGLSITLAHTAVIYLIGFVLLALDRTSESNVIVGYIEKFSAWLFLGLGLILFYNGHKAYKHYKFHQEEHEHHTYNKYSEHRHDHKHNHHHYHGHLHSWDNKNLNIKNRWDLFYAGISGGIIPCIDALSILFLFTSLGRVDIGIIFVFIFSLGLASAIVLLGLSLLYGKDKLKLEEKIGHKAEYILPIASGIIILFFGIFYILTK